MYRDHSVGVWGTWEQAHDMYLEIFQGLGLMFGSMRARHKSGIAGKRLRANFG